MLLAAMPTPLPMAILDIQAAALDTTTWSNGAEAKQTQSHRSCHARDANASDSSPGNACCLPGIGRWQTGTCMAVHLFNIALQFSLPSDYLNLDRHAQAGCAIDATHACLIWEADRLWCSTVAKPDGMIEFGQSRTDAGQLLAATIGACRAQGTS